MRRLCVVALLLGCSNPTPGERLDEVVTSPDAPAIAPFTECEVVTFRAPAASRGHVEVCSTLDYEETPPAGGDHYGQWAAFGVYDAPVPWGFLVHSMEHGGVVLAHDCDGCDAVAELEAIASERDDPLCRGEDVPNRMLVAPMELEGAAIAAVAWEHVYLATCLDRPSLEAFIDAHYGDAPEELCVSGVDRAASGWCP